MTRADEMRLVIGLACETEDRAPEEQRALLTVALRLDCERGRFAATNPEPVEPSLVALVRESYNPDGPRVDLTAPQTKRYETLRARWVRCEKCGTPMGAHYADDECPS